MTINLTVPNLAELKPRITVFGVGGAGGNAVGNMIESQLEGVEFVVANTDAQALTQSPAERRIQMGNALTQGLGAGSQPQIGAGAAEEALPEIMDQLAGSHMAFITAGMGGGTGTGAAPVIARAAKEQGILTVAVVTKPFHFEGQRRMELAERGIDTLAKHVDTLIVIPNQNLFRVANEKTTFAAAFAMADQVLYSGVASITELMTKDGLINLDFADVRAIMSEMGKAMMGTGEASGEKRAIEAAEAAIANPLLDDVCMRGARGLLISITGGPDLTLYEVDEAATRIREEVDPEANIILGATFDDTLEGTMRVSVVATGLNEEALAGGHYDDEVEEEPQHQMTYGYSSAPQIMAEKPEELPIATNHSSIPEMASRPAAPQPHGLEMAHDDDNAESEEINVDHTLADHDDMSTVTPAIDIEENQAEMTPALARRMPEPEDFPPIARQQMEARQSQVENIAEHAQKKRRGLLERLAGVGLGSKHDSDGGHKEPQIATDAETAGIAEAPEAYAAPSQVKPEAHIDPDIKDDQLEIPAFLRRQAN